VNAKLHFIVFFSFISQSIYYWHMGVKNATEKFGEYFLGVFVEFGGTTAGPSI